MDAHLEAIPSLGPFTTGCLPGGDTQGLGGHADGSLHLKVLLLGSALEICAHLLQALDVAAGESDADAMGWDFLHRPLQWILAVSLR